MMTAENQIRYIERFVETYFGFSDAESELREAACLKLQYSECILPPSGDELLCGKLDAMPVGFAMQDNGMGYFLNAGLFSRLCNLCPEQKEHIEALKRRFLPQTGKAQLVQKTPEHILWEVPTDDFSNNSNIGFWLCRMSSTQLDFDKFLQLGIPGLREQILAQLKECEDLAKERFYHGLLAVLDAYCEVAESCAVKAECSDAANGAKIARILRAITARKPQSFHEAAQMMYLYAIVSGTYNYGRMDEYLGDFLCYDLDNGIITEEEALAILIDLWKLFIHRKTTWNGRVIVGGKGRRNEENADRFALLAIKVAGIVKDVLPQFTLRFYDGQNPILMEAALRGIGKGCVYPLLYNDDVNIPSVQKVFGVPLEEAEQYLPFGCGEYIIYHKSVGTPSDIINLLKALEITLFNGYDNVTGKPLGLQTGKFSEFADFESFFEAYCKQVEHYTELHAEHQKVEYQVAAEHSPFLMASLLYDDCIMKGKPIFDGGARYMGGTFETYGNINTANSLTAIKKLVFDEKVIAPDTLLDMLKKNFEGYEREHKLLLDAPKYGNDDAEADEMAIRVHEHICLTTKKQAERVGLDSYLVVVINNSANSTLGRFVMASADGRMAGEHMANANNPTGGSDKNGLTAMLNSLIKLKTDIHAGSVQNIKFSKEMFEDNFDLTRNVLDAYFKNGGSQIMINVLGREDLENALKEPEKYQNLIVRVGGFCARFVELSADVQKEILSRTMY